MNSQTLDHLRATIRDVPNFPKPGILFKDITPVLGDHALLSRAIDGMIDATGVLKVDKVVGIDARGFIFGSLIASRLGAGFVPIRKKGKLPWKTRGVDYSAARLRRRCISSLSLEASWWEALFSLSSPS
jgi:adenine phosphoribosyltransferase